MIRLAWLALVGSLSVGCIVLSPDGASEEDSFRWLPRSGRGCNSWSGAEVYSLQLHAHAGLNQREKV